MEMTQKSILQTFRLVCLLALISVLSSASFGQALSAGTVAGVVLDPNNAAVPNASVTIANSVTGFKRTVSTNTDGTFRFDNVPPNNYQLSVSASGFEDASQSLSVRTSVPISLKIPLSVGRASETVTVTGGGAGVLGKISFQHTHVDQTLITRFSVKAPGSGLGDVVTMAGSRVVADLNRFF